MGQTQPCTQQTKNRQLRGRETQITTRQEVKRGVYREVTSAREKSYAEKDKGSVGETGFAV